MSSTHTEPAPAKLNLFLHVTGRRDDGYHLLDSLVCFADCGDVITATARDDSELTLAITGPMAGDLGHGNLEVNLTLRSACLLWLAGAFTQFAYSLFHTNLPSPMCFLLSPSHPAAHLLVLLPLRPP